MAIRFGVMSDTHGNHAFAAKVADIMIAAGASFIYHLGDNYEDAEMLQFSGLDVRAVPGLWCPEYGKSGIPNIIVDEIDGIRIACAHTVDELRKYQIKADVYFFGHTHRACVEKVNGFIHINPGHLKRQTDRDERASYALVDITEGKLDVTIMDLEGSKRLQREFQIERNDGPDI